MRALHETAEGIPHGKPLVIRSLVPRHAAGDRVNETRNETKQYEGEMP